MLKFTPYARIGTRTCFILPTIVAAKFCPCGCIRSVEIAWAYCAIGVQITRHVEPAKNRV